MKRLIKTVVLDFFNDDATGDWGLTHRDTISYDQGFNAFWSAIGIFHDVWEHNHEYSNKYFRGKYAMNVGGEMAAMGALWYYRNKLGMYNSRLEDGYRTAADNMRETTGVLVEEAVRYGYSNFGATLESAVPRQRPVDDYELEDQIDIFWKNARDWNFSNEGTYVSEDEIRWSKEYKESVTRRKIADLHRWGFRNAERLVPDNWDNKQTLCNFMTFWEEFLKNNSADDLKEYYSGITFRIYKEDDRITWRAILRSKDSMIKNYIINTPDQVEIEEKYQYV